MKLPSLSYLSHSAARAFVRFPLTILSAAIAVVIGVYLCETNAEPFDLRYINVMLCAALGISMFFCITVFSDKQGYGLKIRVLLHIVAMLLLGAIYLTLPDSKQTLNTALPYIRYTIYSIVMHLLVAFVPYTEKGKLNGFWHYNKILFVRFLTAALYSGFLYGGLALALASLRWLFDVHVHDELFGDLFIVIGGLFNTWFFIAGIPQNFNELDDLHEYPRGIKIFSQYVLLPLLILYLVILYVYTGKIIVLWNWPKGMVSYLVSCVAVLGILTLLLIHPYGHLSGNGWIRKFSRIYYFVLFPLVVLLFIAVGMRIADYGITINRYIIVLLGIWLTIVCSYFTLGKTNIKFIPVSLAVIMMLASFGYWGMFSVSERSQVNRLGNILENYKILRNGKIEHEVIWRADSLPMLYAVDKDEINEGLMPDSVHNEVRSIFSYLDNHHGFELIRDWYKQDIDSMIRVNGNKKDHWRWLDEASAYMRSMGLKDEYLYNSSDESVYFSSESSEDRVIDIQGFDYLLRKDAWSNDDSEFTVGGVKCAFVHPQLSTDRLLFLIDNDTLVFQTDVLARRLISEYGSNDTRSVPSQEMSLQSSGRQWHARLDIEHLNVYVSQDTVEVNGIGGELLLKKMNTDH